MKYHLIFSVFILLILSACKGRHTFWNISRFNIDQNSLADSQLVKLIYYSNGPDLDNMNGVLTSIRKEGKVESQIQLIDYYLQYVVIPVGSSDTCNILTPEAIELNQNDGDEIFMYIKNAEGGRKLMYNIQKIKDGENVNSIKMEIPQFDRVARDRKFDFIADNKFKTVIGFIERKK